MVNYPGVGTCSGKDLTNTMYLQAEYFGAEFLIAEATGLELKEDIKIVHTNRGDFKCLGVLLATGAHPKMVGFKGEAEYKGRGVAYCATCDGEFFSGKEVFVIGGGFAAAEESVFLTKFASHVTIIIRGEDFSCAKAVADSARNHEKITVITDTVVEEVKDIAELDGQGYIITDKSQKTSVTGLYAAGDICIKPLRQVVTATSDGALAATELEKYVAKVQERTGLRTQDPVIRDNVFGSKTEKKSNEDNATKSNGLLTPEMCTQLKTVFERMEKPLVLKLYLDNRPVFKELQEYVEALTAMTDKLSMELVTDKSDDYAPCVKLYKDDSYTGLAFHGVPGGHEFTSFVLGMYNSSGPGQVMDEDIRKRITNIRNQVDIKILVSLSCTMCPDLVIVAQHMAAIGEHIVTEIYDIHHYESLKNKYKVMSVPCMIINDTQVYFGKKNIQQILEIVEGIV